MSVLNGILNCMKDFFKNKGFMGMNRKRILLISPMPPLVGGVSVSSWRLFLRLKADGYDVSYYNLKFANSRYNYPFFLILRMLWIPFYICMHRRYDVVHCHVSGVLRKFYLSLMRPLYKGAKLIYTLHGDVENLIENTFCIWALNRADRIICVQEGDSRKLPLKVVKKAIDIPAFIMPVLDEAPDIPLGVREFIAKDNKPLILFNGALVFSERYSDLYGFGDALDAYFLLKKRGFSIKLLMVVNGGCSSEIQCDFLKNLKCKVRGEKDVLIIDGGFSFWPLFSQGTLYLRPTKTDGDSLSVRESLALGCPVVASDSAIRPDAVHVFSLGNIEDLSEKIIQILRSPYREAGSSFDFYSAILAQYSF